MNSPTRPRLTRRQEEILREMLRGATARQIAQELGISTSTVHSHLRAIYAAFRVSNRTRAVIAALESGFTPSCGTASGAHWAHDRATIQNALKEACKPCEAHSAHHRDCAVCVKAGTLIYALHLLKDPRAAVPSPPPAIVAADALDPGDGDPTDAIQGSSGRRRIQVPVPRRSR